MEGIGNGFICKIEFFHATYSLVAEENGSKRQFEVSGLNIWKN